jgi:SAM-dependent methyltransferase
MPFNSTYSQYYNLLYKDKDYESEFTYIAEMISMFGGKDSGRLLDIGCGTGRHLKCCQDAGYDVSGVDLSENMLLEARSLMGEETELLCARASDFYFDKKFDIITSLFHVMSYQTETDELERVFANVSNHLNAGGLFLFDFWYGPAVLTDPPYVKIKRLEDENVLVTRLTEPGMRYNENIVDVNFEVIVENKKIHSVDRIFETHNMRYFFFPEIQYFARKSGFSLVTAYKWFTKEPLSDKSWYGFTVLKKI